VGEAVFAPSSPGADEDDGYVMAFVHNPDRGATDLAIIAAQDFTGAPVARVHLPARVPLGFHGSWIADWEEPGHPGAGVVGARLAASRPREASRPGGGVVGDPFGVGVGRPAGHLLDAR
jgi:hypothetical protein